MQEIEINRDTVELFKVLKFESIAASGGEAKSIIAQGEVAVNGELELRKRRKLAPGDVIEVFDEQYVLVKRVSDGKESKL
ncbi:MAG: RNA-binding S4 domain-containing protein [Gammaproteobacteria bacterium]